MTSPSDKPSPTPRWVHVHNKDELEAFYRSVLENIRKEAEYHGYAIGVHGSLRRDLDLIAVPWKDDHSDKNDLAAAIQEAACGFPQESYQWEEKPCGRLAVSFPVCWTEKSDGFPAETNLGHIDLSVMSFTPSSIGENGLLRQLVLDCQNDLATYIVPDSGISEHDVVNTLLGRLDGPQSRAALSTPSATERNTIIEECALILSDMVATGHTEIGLIKRCKKAIRDLKNPADGGAKTP